MKKLFALLLLFSMFTSPAMAATGVNNFVTLQGKVTNTDGTNVADNTYDFVFNVYHGASSGAASQFTESWTDAALFSSTMSAAPTSGQESLTYSSNANESTLKVGQVLWNVTKQEPVTITSVDTSTNVIGISPARQTWNNTDTITNKIYVKDGIFRVALNSLNQNWNTVDFSQDGIFVGVNFNNDGEMKPRIQFSSVPYAQGSSFLDGIDSAGFLRSNASDTYEAGNTLTVAGDLDINGNISMADTDITLDGASTNLTVTGNFSINTDDVFVNKSTGNVAIGSTNPGTAKLHVTGDMVATGNINATGNLQTGGTERISATGELKNISTTQFNSITYTWPGSQTANYILQTNGTGTLTWANPDALVANSSANYWQLNDQQISPKNSTHDLMIGGTSTASAKIALKGTTGDAFFTGNVGIGTTNPTNKLQVYEETATTTGLSTSLSLKLATSGTAANTFGNVLDFSLEDAGGSMISAGQVGAIWSDAAAGNTGGTLIFRTSGIGAGEAERMRIDHAGNVGIGTTNPIRKLHVTASANSSDLLQLTNSDFVLGNTGSGLFVATGATSGNTFTTIHAFINGGANGGDLILNNYGGNVGIGNTNPQYKLDVGGDVNITGTFRVNGTPISTGGGTIGGSGTVNYVPKFVTNSTTIGNSSIWDNGNVGIGTTVPISKLHISGSVATNLTFQNRNSSIFAQDVGIGATASYEAIVGTAKEIGSTGATVDRNSVAGYLMNAANTDYVAGGSLGYQSDSYGDVVAAVNGYAKSCPAGYNCFSGYYGSASGSYPFVVYSGNMGVGTTSPGYKLDVNGSLGVGSTAYFASTVGMGTATPREKLSVIGNIWTTGVLRLNINDFSGGTIPSYPTKITSTPADSAPASNLLDFYVANGTWGGATEADRQTRVMTLTGGGRVGIGTTTPANTLDIGNSGGIRIASGVPGSTSYALYNNSGTLTWNGVALSTGSSVSGTTNYIPKFTGASSLGNSVIYETGNNIGIGTTAPAGPLSIQWSANSYNSDMFLRNTSSGTLASTEITLGNDASAEGLSLALSSSNWQYDVANIAVLYNRLNGPLAFGTNNTERMRILAGGNVGIGTTAPGVKLQIHETGATNSQLTISTDALAGSGNAILGLTTDADGTPLNARIGLESATNTLKLVHGSPFAGSANGIIINSSGNVGIGTTNPGNHLELVKDQNLPTIFQITNANSGTGTLARADVRLTVGSQTGYLFLTGASNPNFGLNQLNLYNNGTNAIGFWTNSTERIHIHGDGNVGIGTTSPSQKLDVTGAIRLGAAGANNVLHTSAAGGAATGALYWGNSPLVTESSLGSYGVSSITGTPNQITASASIGAVTLSLPSDLRAPGTFNAVTSIATGAGAGTVRIDASGNLTNIGTIGASGTLTFSGVTTDITTGANEHLALMPNGTGNVGIGTTAPGYKLEVNGSFGVNGGSTSTFTGPVYLGNSNDNVYFNLTQVVLNASSGNLGIGTTAPGYKLDVNGTLGVGSTAYFASTVGIGTTNPGYKLDVNGTFRAASTAYFGATVGIGTTNNGYPMQLQSTSSNWHFILGNFDGASTNLRFIANNGYSGISSFADNVNTTAPLALNKDGGNVGIGTTNPLEVLDVAGRLRLAQTTAPGVTVDKLYNVGGALYWNGTNLSSGTSKWSNGSGSDIYRLSGNVGIGTTAPSTNLTVYNGNESTTLTNFTQSIANGGINIQTDYTNGAYTPGLFWSTSDENPTKPKAGIFLNEGSAGTMMLFGTSNNYTTGITNTNLVLSPTGNVGIGTTNPGYKLEVAGGDLNLTTGTFRMAGTDYGQYFIDGAGSNGQVWKSDGAGRGYWAADTDTNTTYTAGNDLDLNGTQFDIESQLDYVSVISRASSSLTLQTTTSGNIILNPAGNVGIGTTNPLSKFTVKQTSEAATGGIRLEKSSSTDSWSTYFGSNNTLHTVWQDTNPIMSLRSNGFVGIGTTNPGMRLELASTTQYDGINLTNGTNSVASIYGSAAGMDNGVLQLRTGGTVTTQLWANGVNFLNGGNVGIGTTSPTHKLDVSGNIGIEASGYLNFGATDGTSGYGLRDNGGTMQYKNSAGSWTNIGSGGATYTASNGITLSASDFQLGGTLSKNTDIALGSYNLTFSGAGNVGIGTTTPNIKLSVAGTAGTNGDSRYLIDVADTTSFASGVGGGIRFSGEWRTTPGSAEFASIKGFKENGTDGNYAGALAFMTRPHGSTPVERLRITSDGNVGIGTTNSGYKLEVHTPSAQSDINISTNVNLGSANTTQLSFTSDKDGTPSTASIGQFNTGDLRFSATGNLVTPHLLISKSSGNVGIGTTAPNGTFSVENILQYGPNTMSAPSTTSRRLDLGLLTLGSNYPGINFNTFYNGSNNVYTSTDSAFGIWQHLSQDKLFFTYAAPGTVGTGLTWSYGMTMDNSGNIGIGTTNPGALLDLQSSNIEKLHLSQFSDAVDGSRLRLRKARGTQASPTIVNVGDNTGAYVFQGYDGSTYRNTAFILSGVDATPGAGDMPGNLTFWTTADNGSTSFERMRIDNGGNIGIGTTAPTAQLTVANTAAFNAAGDTEIAYNLNFSNETASYINSNANLYILAGDPNANQNLTLGSAGGGTVNITSGLINLYDASGARPQINTNSALISGESTMLFAYPAADGSARHFLFRANNTNLLSINGNGSVGVNTDTPTNTLHVQGTGGGRAGIYLNSAVPSSTSYTLYNNAGTLTWNGVALTTGASVSGTTGYMPKFTAASTLGNSQIYDTGTNIGIGTSVPTQKLHVTSAGSTMVEIDSQATGRAAQVYMYRGSGAANYVGPSTSNIFDIYTQENIPMRMHTNATERLRITADGNVGIGTTSPVYLLEVAGSNTNHIRAINTSALGAGSGGFFWGTASTTPSAGNQRLGGIVFGAPNSLAGNVATSGITGWADEAWVSNTSYASHLRFETTASGSNQRLERMRLTSSGNLGIGTTNPGKLFEVVKAGDTAIRALSGVNGNQTSIAIGRTANDGVLGVAGAAGHFSAGSVVGDIILRQEDAAKHLILQAGTGAAVVSIGSSNVGIGTTNPEQVLHVASTATSALYLEGDTDNATETDTSFIKFSQDNRAVQAIFGTVGAGGSSPENAAYAQTITNATLLGTLDTYGHLQFGTNDAVRMTIETSGYVGIGTTNPAYPLDVVGDVNITGTFRVNGTALAAGGNVSTSGGTANYLPKFTGGTAIGNSSVFDNGNVGIGNTSPLSKLAVQGTASQLNFSESDNVGGFLTSTADHNFAISGGAKVVSNNWQARATSAGAVDFWNGTMSFWSNTGLSVGATFSPTERMRIDSSGNVGIGTTNPSTFKLEVAGSIGPSVNDTYDLGSDTRRFRDLYLGPGTLHIGTSVADGYSMSYDTANNRLGFNFANSGNPEVTFDSAGNVGIGTTNPLAPFHAQTSRDSSTSWWLDADSTALVYNQHASGDAILKLAGVKGRITYGGGLDTDKLIFSSRQSAGTVTESVTIDNNGNLGVGTTNPGSKLAVSGNSAALPAGGLTDIIAQFGNTDSTGSRVVLDSFNANPNLTFRRSNGTAASPTALLNNDPIGALAWFGYGSTGYTSTARVQITGWAAENWSDAAQGAYLAFTTTGKTTASPRERMRIDDAGNVGIGTTNPSERLSVITSGTTSLLNVLGVFNPVTGGSAKGNGTAILIGNNSGAYYNKIASIYEQSSPGYLNPALAFFTMNETYLPGSEVERMRISSSGNVGIGTTNPSTKLDVSGNMFVGSAGSFSNGEGWNGVIELYGSSHARQSIRTSNIDLRLMSHVTGFYGSPSGAIIATSTNHPLSFGTNSNTRMTIASDGNVGIGTTNPLAKTHIDSYTAGNTTEVIQKWGWSNNSWALNLSQEHVSGSHIEWRFSDQYSNQLLSFDRGNVGIGTTNPTNKLSVIGNANFATGTYGSIGLSTPSNYTGITFLTNDTNQYRADIRRYGTGLEFASSAVGVGSIPTTKFAIRDADNAVYAYGAWQASWSDVRLKHDITPQQNSLDKILALNPVTYYWNADVQLDDKMHYGIIAQEFQKVFPEMVYEDENGRLNVKRDELQFVLAKAIQELNTKVDANGDIAGLQERITTVETKTTQLDNQFSVMSAEVTTQSNTLNDTITSIQNLLTQVTSLFTKQQELSQNQDLLKNTMADLQSQVSTMSAVAGITSEVQQQSEINLQQADEISSVSARLAALETSSLQPTASVSNDRLADIEAQIATLSATIASIDLSLPLDASTAAIASASAAMAPADIAAALTDLTITPDMIDVNTLFVKDFLSVMGDSILTNVNVTNMLTVGQINALDGKLDLLAGLMTLDSAGQVTISGNLKVLGLAEINKAQVNELTFMETATDSAIASPAASIAMEDGNLKVNLASSSAFQIADNASISASGSAKFAELAADTLRVSAETASPSATVNGPILSTTASAGTTLIPEGYSHVTIQNTKITKHTLIYVTPLSSTSNRSLYVKLQDNGQAVIGFDTPNTKPVTFNWWLVEPTTQASR